jgi:DNA replication protein DnaD
MRKHIHTILTATIGVFTVFLIAKSVSINRDVTMLQMNALAKTQAQVPTEAISELTGAELLTVKHTVDGLITHYRLPLKTIVQAKTITIYPLDETSTDQGEEKDHNRVPEVLADFRSLTGFFSALSTISYSMDITDLCVGKECPKGFSLAAKVSRL